MSYLAIARSALLTREKGEERPHLGTAGQRARSSDGEISEESEQCPGCELDQPALSLEEAEQLKARIIAVVTVDPAEFDRALYDVLMAEWLACEATLASNNAEPGAA
jgi:hypothetical protein